MPWSPSLSFSLSFPLSDRCQSAWYRWPAARKIDSLPSAPSGSTTSRKISWELKGASLLLRRTSGPLIRLTPSLPAYRSRYVFYFLSLSFSLSRKESRSFLLARLPGAAVCFSESGPTGRTHLPRSMLQVDLSLGPVAPRHGTVPLSLFEVPFYDR